MMTATTADVCLGAGERFLNVCLEAGENFFNVCFDAGEKSLKSSWRGPALLLAVITIISFRCFSIEFLVQCSLLLMGTVVTIHDYSHDLQRIVRRRIRQVLDNIVLDDVLGSPSIGRQLPIIDYYDSFNRTLGGIVATAAMYSLPTTPDQRLRLVASQLDDQEASAILLEPGGVKRLLPGSIRGWIDQEDEEDNNYDKREGKGGESKVPVTEGSEIAEYDDAETDAETEEHLSMLPRRDAGSCPTIDFSSEEDGNSVRNHSIVTTVAAAEISDENPQDDDVPDTTSNAEDLPDPASDARYDRSMHRSRIGQREGNKSRTTPRRPRVSAQRWRYANVEVGEQEDDAEDDSALVRPRRPRKVAIRPLSSPHEEVIRVIQEMIHSQAARCVDMLPQGTPEMASITASIILLLQLRYSCRARETIWTAFQAMTTVASSATLVGALGALAIRWSQPHAGPPNRKKISLPLSNALDLSVNRVCERNFLGRLALLLVFYCGIRWRVKPRLARPRFIQLEGGTQ